MKLFNIHKVLKTLKKQVSTLDVPYIDAMSGVGRDPFKVLISCILSLRTQDRTTAAASERLFAIASNAEKMAGLSIDVIEKAIYPVGFYRVKAKQIKSLCTILVKKYNGAVPDTIDELLGFKGVGRKTANLVLTRGFDKYGICVDTHVHRITNRWGYVDTKTPEKTETALREKLPKKYWKDINGILVAFGQGVCKPISPQCDNCTIREYCKYSELSKSG